MNTDHFAQMYLIASLAFLAAAGLLYFTRMHHQAVAPKRRYTVYRHKKTGGHYAVLFIGKLESDSSTCIIYAPVDELDSPTPWVRDYNEFFDGRFEFIGTITYEYCNPTTTKGK